MSSSDQTPNPRTLWDRVLGGAGGVFLLLIAAAMTYALLFPPPESLDEPEPGLIVFGVLLLVSLWSLGVSFLMGCFGSRRAERMGGWLTLAGCLAFVGFVVWANLYDEPSDSTGKTVFSARGATLVMLFALVLAFGALLYFKRMRDAAAQSEEDGADITRWPGFILFWPVFFMLKSMLMIPMSLIVLGPLVLLTYLGARIGAIWGHPLLGAICGPPLWAGLVALFILVGNRLWGREKPVPQPGAAAEPGDGQHPDEPPDA
ncbi:MAG: hypothetical protein JXB13_12240 [Phycisphaerae bacterium]|nr:hypothetical protein [Phycisphaerae bacterium]